MNFSEPSVVGNVIDTMWTADLQRSPNRVVIDECFNGFPPYTATEQDENQLQVNVNWKEAAVLGHHARRQYENAFLKPEHFFTVAIEDAPLHKRDDWASFITKRINKPMKKSWAYIQGVRSRFAGVVLHGVGPQLWASRWAWRAKQVAIEDLMIPTDTTEDMENLQYFAVRRVITPGELIRKALSKNSDPGWKKAAVKEVLKQYEFLNNTAGNYNWMDSPEKMQELFKQNSGWYDSDSAPSIITWEFYHYEEEDVQYPGWRKKIILGKNNPSAVLNSFLYDGGSRICAHDLSELLHIQFGDLNNKPPFMYHSVRSLGFLLYDVCQMMNRLRCTFTQRVFEDLMIWIRSRDPSDHARANMIALFNRCIVPDGVSFIPTSERPNVNANLVEQLMSNYRQLMAESSSTFTQDIDNGTQREVTATETMARVNQVNALLGGMLNLAYVQETFAYTEVCRRFCLQGTEDRDCRKFQQQCQEHGIPRRYLNPELWDIVPETTLGGGNKILEMAQAEKLMAVRPLLKPSAQDKVIHKYVEAVSDSRIAKELAPIDEGSHITKAVHDAQLSFGAMMDGTPVDPVEGVNHVEQIEEMLKLMGMRVQMIQRTDGMGTPKDIMGFTLVARNISSQIQLLSQDDAMKERVTAYQKALQKIGNMIKAFAQRQQQAAQQAAANGNGQLDPETMSKIQSDQILAQAKARGKDATTAQSLRHKEEKFRQGLQQDSIKTAAEIRRENARTAADLQGDQARTAQELHGRAMVHSLDAMDDAMEPEPGSTAE